MRIDLTSLAARVPAGHRLAVVVGYTGVMGEYFTTTHAPEITIHADDQVTASHIVVPLLSGTVGGDVTTLKYPPRPFLPKLRYRD